MAIKNYFVNGITAHGYIDFFSFNIQGLKKVFVLKGQPKRLKSELINSIVMKYKDNLSNIECIHNPLNPDVLNAIIIPEINIAVADGAELHISPTRDRVIEQIDIDICDNSKLSIFKEDIVKAEERITECCDNARKCFAEGLVIHDEWEKCYIEHTDFEKSDKLASDTIELLIGSKIFNKKAVVKHRFFGASTPNGQFDYIDNITLNMSNRYLLKGRPGTGKSTMLKKLAKASESHGLDTEIYHCGFDSNSLDMVLLPELSVCIFDSTSPHIYKPTKPNDKIIDMYEICVKPGTDEMYSHEIDDISKRYKTVIKQGIQWLAEAKSYQDTADDFYAQAIIPQQEKALYDSVTKKLNRYYDNICNTFQHINNLFTN
ncbi:MAG: hypothetical protein PHH84_06365 [Oscillospiraceae bacterium]|nr:hypothetical protein [Oscillospiraceae bacterium]MDD4413814.1 hypothetical protein [Oscillospiraceae bacterium]